MENGIVDDGKNPHGFPQGYHFIPHDQELMRLLDLKLDGRRLPEPLPNIFSNVKIHDSHPAVLYDQYKKLEEAGYIYFFDHRQYQTKGRKPKRTTKDGGTWKASGGGEELKRGGVIVGYKLTMIFYQKEKPHKTHWALKEYTRIVDAGPGKKVESLALYRLYKKKPGQGAVPILVEVEASQASVAASSTSPQAQEQASNGQPHHHDHQYMSKWVTAAAGCMGQSASPTWPRQEAVPVNHFGYAAGLAGWDNMPLLSLPPPIPPSAVGPDLPVWGHSSYPETTYSNSEPPLPPLLLPAPAADAYLADEVMVFCKTKQKQDETQAASPCSRSPMTYDDLFLDLPKLVDEDDSHLYSCTLEELLAPLKDMTLQDLRMPDTNQDDTAASANEV